MGSKKRFLKVEETLDYISNLEEKGQRKADLIGFRSSDSCTHYKHIISICTSISVILMQYNLYHIALKVLKKASENDEKLIKFGSTSDKLWQGRLHIFTNLSFLYHRYSLHSLGSPTESLAFIQESQSFLLTLQKSGVQVHEDLRIGTDMLTFMLLWLCGKIKQASFYLDSAARSVNIIIKGTPTKLHKKDLQNLYGLIVCSLAALSVKMGGDTIKAAELCEKSQKEFHGDTAVNSLVNQVIAAIQSRNTPVNVVEIEFLPCAKEYHERSYKFPGISEEAIDRPLPAEENWLVNKVYNNLLLESAFSPMISPSTPALRQEELEFERVKTKLLEIIEDSDNNEIEVNKRNYSSVPRIAASRNSPKRAAASVLKARVPSVPWWQKNQFINKVLSKNQVGSREIAELRVNNKKHREAQNLTPVESQVQEIYQSRASPRRLVFTKRTGKRNGKANEDIMVKFNTGIQKEGETLSVALVPVVPSSRKCTSPTFYAA